MGFIAGSNIGASIFRIGFWNPLYYCETLLPANSGNAISPKYAFQIRLVIRLGIRFESVLDPLWDAFGIPLDAIEVRFGVRFKCIWSLVVHVVGSGGCKGEGEEGRGRSPETDPKTDYGMAPAKRNPGDLYNGLANKLLGQRSPKRTPRHT